MQLAATDGNGCEHKEQAPEGADVSEDVELIVRELTDGRQEIINRASPTLRKLLGADYHYPQVLDTGRAEAG